MPTYQYRCTDCGASLEVVQRFADEPLTVCPSCSGRLRKVFSPVGVVFKGSGFYKTDSRSSGTSPKQEPAATDGAGKQDAGKDAGTTSAPAKDAAAGGGSGSGAVKPAGEPKPAGKGTHKVA